MAAVDTSFASYSGAVGAVGPRRVRPLTLAERAVLCSPSGLRPRRARAMSLAHSGTTPTVVKYRCRGYCTVTGHGWESWETTGAPAAPPAPHVLRAGSLSYTVEPWETTGAPAAPPAPHVLRAGSLSYTVEP